LDTFAKIEVGTDFAGESCAPDGFGVTAVTFVVVVEDFFVDVVFHLEEVLLVLVFRERAVAVRTDVEVGDGGGLEPPMVQLDGGPAVVAVYFVRPLVVQLPELVSQRKPPCSKVVVPCENLHLPTPRQHQVYQFVNLV
jgi:hypothetical protein